MSDPHVTESALMQVLAACVDASGLLPGVQAGERYQRDWTGRGAVPLVVVRPRDTAQVAAVMGVLHRLRQPVVVQGGMTGLVGAAVPQAGEVVLSMERMNAIGEVDPLHGTVLVEAGAVLQSVQQQVQQQGWLFPVDIGSRGSCQIGGIVSTNAGGNRVLRWGMTRACVRGLEAVLADGRVISRLSPMLKDNTGYDLVQPFIGSEGTLGVVTRVLLGLQPLPRSRHTAFVALEGIDAAIALMRRCRARLGPLFTSFEVMWQDYLDAVAVFLPAARPFPRPVRCAALIEIMGDDESGDGARLQSVLAEAMDAAEAQDVVLARSMADADRLWAIRDAVGEASQQLSPWVGFDVSLPLGRMGHFLQQVHAELARTAGLRKQTYGHLGDGNLHLVIGPVASDGGPSSAAAVKQLVHGTAAAMAGSISGEHGIGMAKKLHLGLNRSAHEIDVMRSLKRALDPLGLLNRGRIFDPA